MVTNLQEIKHLHQFLDTVTSNVREKHTGLYSASKKTSSLGLLLNHSSACQNIKHGVPVFHNFPARGLSGITFLHVKNGDFYTTSDIFYEKLHHVCKRIHLLCFSIGKIPVVASFLSTKIFYGDHRCAE